MNSGLLWYSNVLRVRPIIGNAVSGIFIFGFGDYLCQEMELRVIKKPGKIDITRILKSSMFGIIFAPYLHLQYGILVPKLFPGQSTSTTIKGILYAVTVSDSIFNIGYFIFMKLCNKDKLSFDSSFANELMEKFVPVQITSMKVWLFLTGFNFFIVPAHFRVVFDNTLCIFWNMYLSYVEHNT
jgi:hypothetical protein